MNTAACGDVGRENVLRR